MKLAIVTGDSAYPLTPWMMKIFDANNLSIAQRNFNSDLCSARQLIERSIGLLKIRFRCILGERKLRYMPRKVGKFVYACATLHNFLISNGFDIMHDIDQNLLRNVVNHHQNGRNVNLPNANLRAGQLRRNEVVLYLQNFRQ